MSSLSSRLARRVAGVHLRGVGALSRGRPLPLRYWLGARAPLGILSRQPHPLLPPEQRHTSTGATLAVPELRQLLANDELGTWALDQRTLEFLWECLGREQPSIIVEVGAGASTLVLARYAASRSVGAATARTVFSLEQGHDVKEKVEQRLKEQGLDEYVHVIHAPVSAQGTPEWGPELLREAFGSRRADWLLIDGPAGPEGCRAWTLPLLREFCHPGAHWFLDDSFRDGELRILREWSRLPGFAVEGIYPFGKGLATGRVTP